MHVVLVNLVSLKSAWARNRMEQGIFGFGGFVPLTQLVQGANPHLTLDGES